MSNALSGILLSFAIGKTQQNATLTGQEEEGDVQSAPGSVKVILDHSPFLGTESSFYRRSKINK